MCDQQSLRSACAYAQSDQSLCRSLEYYVTVVLLTEQHLEFLSLKGAAQTRTDSPESILGKCHIFENHISRLIYGFIVLDPFSFIRSFWLKFQLFVFAEFGFND